jgi:preprotein translocase subunit SecY
MIGIVARLPFALVAEFGTKLSSTTGGGSIALIVELIIWFLVIVATIALVQAVRKVPVQYAKRIVGNRQYGGVRQYIPLKINAAGVMPIIFAMSLFQFPIIVSQLLGYKGTGIWSEVLKYLNEGNWFQTSQWKYSIGLVVYILLMIFFAYFYTDITFNPLEIADNLKKQGGFIPGIRPGKPTSDYLQTMLKYIVLIGVCGLIIIAVLPIVFNGLFNANVSFGGTSLIIVVSVILETVKQIESQMLVRNYKGFLDD